MKRAAFFRNLRHRICPSMEVLVCDKERCLRREIPFGDASRVKNDELAAEKLEALGYKEIISYEKIIKILWLNRLENNKPPFVLTLEDLPNCRISRLVYIDRKCQMWIANLEQSHARMLKKDVQQILKSSGDYRPNMADFRKVTTAKRIYQELFKDFIHVMQMPDNRIDVLQVKSTV